MCLSHPCIIISYIPHVVHAIVLCTNIPPSYIPRADHAIVNNNDDDDDDNNSYKALFFNQS